MSDSFLTMSISARRLLAIPLRAASFAELGFAPCDAEVRGRLERVLETFIHGFNLCLAIGDPGELAAALRDRFDAHHVGFAFEGAGMYYALLDLLMPWRPSRLRAFLDGPGGDHDVIAAVGAGFAIARLPWGRRLWPWYSGRLDPLIAWCVPEGYGFHEGMVHADRYVAGRAEPPAVLPGSARQLFDSGLGRSLWWSQCASPQRIRQAIDGFPARRRPQMWCGIGVAASYAGGAGDEALGELRELAGPYQADLLSGVPFATRMRQKGGNPSPVTDRACELLLSRTPDDASDWIVATLQRVLADESSEREVRLRDNYRLVRQRLVEDLRGSAPLLSESSANLQDGSAAPAACWRRKEPS